MKSPGTTKVHKVSSMGNMNVSTEHRGNPLRYFSLNPSGGPTYSHAVISKMYLPINKSLMISVSYIFSCKRTIENV